MKKKLLILTSSFPSSKSDYSGIFIFELALKLKNNFDVFILTPRVNYSQKRENFEGLIIFRFKQFLFKNIVLANNGPIMPKLKKNKFYILTIPWFLISQLLALSNIVRKQKISLIHAHWILPQGLIAALYKKFFNKNVNLIVTIHGSDINLFKSNLGKFLLKWTLNNIDLLTVVSTPIKYDVIKLGYKKNVYVYPMGVNTQLFNPKKFDLALKKKFGIKSKFILFVGSLIKLKRIEELIDAMPCVIERFPDIKLIIIGKGILEKKLKMQVQKLKIEKNILFLGFIENKQLPKFYATSDLFILPSKSEGFPVSAMEALSSGTLTLMAQIETVKELIIEKETGFYINKINPKVLSNKIINILQNDYEIIAINGRKHIIKNYSWEIIGEKYKNLLTKF